MKDRETENVLSVIHDTYRRLLFSLFQKQQALFFVLAQVSCKLLVTSVNSSFYIFDFLFQVMVLATDIQGN